MIEFIVDTNIDLIEGQVGYPGYFFEDLRKPNKIGIVIGGTKYNEEVKGKAKLLELVVQLVSAKKARKIDDHQVDLAQKRLDECIVSCFGGCPSECDDQHVLALSKVSGCMNILTRDVRMAKCRQILQGRLSDKDFPKIRIIKSEAGYRESFKGSRGS